MKAFFIKLALGKSQYSTWFLLVFSIIAPCAVFGDWPWVDNVAWVMLIILGVFIFITGLVGKEDAKQSKTWPVAIATLERCYLKHHTSSKSVRYYAPAIQCHFSVGGKVYTGTEYDFSSDYTTQIKAQAKLDEVSSLKQLNIRYKPSDPFTNVYKPGMHSVHFIRQLIGLAAVIVSSLSMLGVITYS